MATKLLQTEFFQQVADIAQLLQALECLPGALFMIKNLDSRHIYMSQALREAINLAQGQEVAGKTDFDLFRKSSPRASGKTTCSFSSTANHW